ncbi:glycosyltransferase family 2 protein [Segetibacter sp. 3557_3]|uniref:glycosyltransferase family 2 protein n=1 Tax=Segetibacter sp. 3557_3 TaxID=2547429 RepID=UPI0010584C49|nr:glycosyltransferase family 2 protein [Segetibacter sp. 3557_3]TDH20860.1 glycosyltransferase family 2 protein [Segetibacter sp. 3557_3]
MFISVIIPTRNRAKTLKQTLEALYRNQPAFGFEVVVVDNGSSDNTADVCEIFNNPTWNFKYVFDAEPGLLTGRHHGAAVAGGEILCFLDDDVEISETWFGGVAEAFSNADVQLATGPSLPKFETPPPGWLELFWEKHPSGGSYCTWLSLLDLGSKPMKIDANFVFGLNFCIRKTALYTLQGFHPDNIPATLQMYQGDGETGLTSKANELGYLAVYHPNIKLFHLIGTDRLTTDYFKKRAFYQGVCNSFSAIRLKHSGKGPAVVENNLGRKLARQVREVLSKTKTLLFPQKDRILRAMLAAEEKRGYTFHQRAFRKNASVQKWVLKPDYWDYKLPA